MGSILNTRKNGKYSQGTSCDQVGEKLPRGNIIGKGWFWLNWLNRIPAEGRPGWLIRYHSGEGDT